MNTKSGFSPAQQQFYDAGHNADKSDINPYAVPGSHNYQLWSAGHFDKWRNHNTTSFLEVTLEVKNKKVILKPVVYSIATTDVEKAKTVALSILKQENSQHERYEVSFITNKDIYNV